MEIMGRQAGIMEGNMTSTLYPKEEAHTRGKLVS